MKYFILGLLGLLAAILGVAIVFGVLFLFTKLVIWIAMGLFAYDLSDKFWYVFGAIVLLNALTGGRLFSINIGAKKWEQRKKF